MAELKEKKKKPTEKKPYSLATRKNLAYIGILIAGILIPSLIVFGAPGLSVWETPTGQYGLYEWFAKPEAPPPEKATGWAKFEVYDLFLGELVDVNISLFWWENESYYTDVNTTMPFLINGSSLCVINDANYYPVTYTVIGSGQSTGDPEINRLGGYRVANNTNVTARITSIDGEFNASYQYTDNITDGYHVVEFTLRNKEWDLMNTTWGLGAWIPQDLLPTEADYYNLSYTGLWMTINGSLENAFFRLESDLNSYPLSFLEIDIGETSEWGNITVFHLPVLNDLTIIIGGEWELKADKGIRFNDYFLDNVTNRYINVPTGLPYEDNYEKKV